MESAMMIARFQHRVLKSHYGVDHCPGDKAVVETHSGRGAKVLARSGMATASAGAATGEERGHVCYRDGLASQRSMKEESWNGVPMGFWS